MGRIRDAISDIKSSITGRPRTIGFVGRSVSFAPVPVTAVVPYAHHAYTTAYVQPNYYHAAYYSPPAPTHYSTPDYTHGYGAYSGYQAQSMYGAYSGYEAHSGYASSAMTMPNSPGFGSDYYGAPAMQERSYNSRSSMNHRDQFIHREDRFGNHEDGKIHEYNQNSDEHAVSRQVQPMGYGQYPYGAPGYVASEQEYGHHQRLAERTVQTHRTDPFGGHEDTFTEENRVSSSEHAGRRGHVGSLYSPSMGMQSSPAYYGQEWSPMSPRFG